MKRSEMLIHMQRAYGIRHVMVENGHLKLEDFMDELLTHMEQKGIMAPLYQLAEAERAFWDEKNGEHHRVVYKSVSGWEKET